MEPKTLKEKAAGRKFRMAGGILAAATTIMVVPALLSWLGVANAGTLMTGGEYVSLVIGVFGLYVSGNVYQKKVLSTAGVTAEEEAGPTS